MTVLAAEAHLPYNRPPLSKGLLRGTSRRRGRVRGAGRVLRGALGRRSPRHRRHRGRDPRETRRARRWHGGRLLPPRPREWIGTAPAGDSGRGLRRRPHASAHSRTPSTVRDAAASAGRALVVGAGFIGMETAASLRTMGLEVTLIEPAESLFGTAREPGAVALARGALPRSRRRGRARRRRHALSTATAGSSMRRRRQGGVDRRPARRRRHRRPARDDATSTAAGSSSTAAPCSSTSMFRSNDPDVFAIGDLAQASTTLAPGIAA